MDAEEFRKRIGVTSDHPIDEFRAFGRLVVGHALIDHVLWGFDSSELESVVRLPIGPLQAPAVCLQFRA